MKPIRRAAVLGAGTMGARIAAHFSNAGIPTLLLDLPGADGDRNSVARAGLKQAAAQKPAALFREDYQDRISLGNFEDDLGSLAGCDWIVEAVAENLEIKRHLLERVAGAASPAAVISTNTSGIPISSIAEGLPPDFRRRWLGTHFFNPPRYMHLVEIIPGRETAPEAVEWISQICERLLGKGVVPARDTPNFIANRIGTFQMASIFRLMVRDGLTIEEVDALTGPAIGGPRSATFRTLDIVGLDVAASVLRNLHENLPGDPRRDWFVLPSFVEKMIERKWLGEKTGQGFYRRQQKRDGKPEILALDWRTLEYTPRKKPKFPQVEMGKSVDDIRKRLPLLFTGGDRAADFLWNLYSEVFVYAASLAGEICDRIVEVDRAMRWGYGQELGPFEAWDVLGVEKVVARLHKEKKAVPEEVERMVRAGAASFYKNEEAPGATYTSYFDLKGGRYRGLEPRPGILLLADQKRAGREIKRNAGASLVDLGDGVLGVEFHSKMNVLGDDQVTLMMAGLKETAANFEAMVIANQGANFSVGANLVLVLMAAQAGEWEDLDLGVRRFQQANMALKYAARPVVGAPFGMTLGGGCEVALHCARNQAAAELYMGLVEASVGVIPAGGGTKEFLLRTTDDLPAESDLLPAVQQAFETIGFAKVSTSAEEARRMKLLRPHESVSMNGERLVADAKAAALALARNYRPGNPRNDIRVMGGSGLAALEVGIHILWQGGYISDYDTVVAGKLAHVLAGGRLTGEPRVAEQYLLDLEREAFLSLCGERRTQERMQHMLKTGKPLRN